MKKSFALLPLAALCAAMIAGCAADGTAYRSDVYSSSSVNRAQEVTTVEIIAISPGRVAVSNTENRDRAQMTGAILGAIAGAAIGSHNNHDTSSRVIGGLAGGAVGALAGDAVGGGSSTSFVEGDLFFALSISLLPPGGPGRRSTMNPAACNILLTTPLAQ